MKFTSLKFIVPIVLLLLAIGAFFVWDKYKTPSLLVSVEEEAEVLVTIENNFNNIEFERNMRLPLGLIIYANLKEQNLENHNHKIIVDTDIQNIYFKTFDKEKNIINGYSSKILNNEIVIHIYLNPEYDLNTKRLEDILNRNYIYGLLDAPQILSENPNYIDIKALSNTIFNQLDDTNLKLIKIKK